MDEKEPQHFTESFSKREMQEIYFSMVYAKDYAHGTAGHNQYMLIAKLAQCLFNLHGPAPRSLEEWDTPKT